MFGTLGWMEIAIIAIIALLIVGPRGLPKLGRSLGRALRNFKREARELKEAVEFEIDEEERKEAKPKRHARRRPKPKPPKAG